MILYSYMHWFWITCNFCVSSCEMVSATIHSISTEISKNISSSDNTFVQEETTDSVSIPPINTNAPEQTMSSIKDVKTQHEKHTTLKLNVTRKVTIAPSIRETTVIELNEKDRDVTVSNKTIVNVLNETENLTNPIQIKSNEESVSVISSAGIVGITLGCISIVALAIAISFVVYRNRGINRPQVLNDHCSNLDSCGYIDDTSIRDNSEEMYSLDNDSFLNSLEAMTIQNYWTDTVKHTKL